MVASQLEVDLSSLPQDVRVECRTGSLGSRILYVHGARDALERAAEQISRQYRKCWRNLASGFAAFMAPSGAHEVDAEGFGDLVNALCHHCGLAVVRMRSTTARAVDDPTGKSGDPDQSFFIGAKAEDFLARAGRDGWDRAAQVMEGIPRDLVIEVEHAHLERAKRSIYRDAGVAELWEVATVRAGRGRAPVIWDLQVPHTPCPIAASRVLPGVRAERLRDALDALRAMGGYGQFMLRVGRGEAVAERLARVAGIPETSG